LQKGRERKRVMLFFHRPQHAGMSHWECERAGNVQQISIYCTLNVKLLPFTDSFFHTQFPLINTFNFVLIFPQYSLEAHYWIFCATRKKIQLFLFSLILDDTLCEITFT
jgi:hypothetical protein